MSILKYVKLLVWTTNARSQPCLQVLFFTLNLEVIYIYIHKLKAGVQIITLIIINIVIGLFGFTLVLSLLLPVIIIKLILS